MIAKAALANGAAIENAAKFPSKGTFWRSVGIDCYSGHRRVLVLIHKALEEIAEVTHILGNENFHVCSSLQGNVAN